jgi:hypothetical protein
MTYQATTELEAVNIMLAAVNEPPVNTLTDSGLSEVTQAQTLLQNVSRDIQLIGWNFNSETEYSLGPDLNGYIYVPLNVLKIDATDSSLNYVQRGTKLYNKTDHTFIFNSPVKTDIVWFLPFSDLPQAAKSYITVKAAREFQRLYFGSETADKLSERDEYSAWLSLLREEDDSQDLNLLTSNSMILMLQRS